MMTKEELLQKNKQQEACKEHDEYQAYRYKQLDFISTILTLFLWCGLLIFSIVKKIEFSGLFLIFWIFLGINLCLKWLNTKKKSLLLGWILSFCCLAGTLCYFIFVNWFKTGV